MKQRYTTLDGMRGVAALMVVYYHAAQLTSTECDPHCNLRFGYMAVDLFFVLSGFVISHSYDSRMQSGMGVKIFLIRRIIRLWPLYLVGVGIGASVLALELSRGSSKMLTFEELALGIFALPSPSPSGLIVPIVPPAWSLFAEFWLANVAFGLFWHMLRGAAVVWIVAIAAIGMITASVFYGTMNVGYLWNTFPGLFPRVAFSFFAGVCVQRLHHRWALPSIPTWTILLITAATLCPSLYGVTASIYELACVLLIYPALIYFGAYAHDSHAPASKILGDTSYAAYVIHFPILLLLLRAMPRLQLNPSHTLAFGFVGAVAGSAYLLQLLYDQPARRWLTRHHPA